jgi:hypothetical protein
MPPALGSSRAEIFRNGQLQPGAVTDFRFQTAKRFSRNSPLQEANVSRECAPITARRCNPSHRRHCERKRSNPWLGIARSKMDCFVAEVASRNDIGVVPAHEGTYNHRP